MPVVFPSLPCTRTLPRTVAFNRRFVRWLRATRRRSSPSAMCGRMVRGRTPCRSQCVAANSPGGTAIWRIEGSDRLIRLIKTDHSRALRRSGFPMEVQMAQFPIMKTLANIAVTQVDGEYRIRIEDQTCATLRSIPRCPIKSWNSRTCSTTSFLTKARRRRLAKVC